MTSKLVDFDIPWAKGESIMPINKNTCINVAGKGGWADANCKKKKSVACEELSLWVGKTMVMAFGAKE